MIPRRRSRRSGGAALEVDHPVVLGAAGKLHGIELGRPSTGMRCTELQHGAADEHGLVIDAVLQPGQAGFFTSMSTSSGRSAAGGRARACR